MPQPCQSENHPLIDVLLYLLANILPVGSFIFINGDFRKNFERAWSEVNSSILWPRDLLPKDIPNAQILAFDYQFAKIPDFHAASLALHQCLTDLEVSMAPNSSDFRLFLTVRPPAGFCRSQPWRPGSPKCFVDRDQGKVIKSIEIRSGHRISKYSPFCSGREVG